MQVLADEHDTPVSSLVVAPGGVGIRWTDQAVPFHASARAAPSCPTAVQPLAEVQDTPVSATLTWACGSGTGWTDHVVPFHCSAAGALAPVGK